MEFAEDNVPAQVEQIQAMIDQGAEALVVAAVDGTALADVLSQAASKDIPVISYDRLIRDTPNIDYYASFDNFRVASCRAVIWSTSWACARPPGPSRSSCSPATPRTTTPGSSSTGR